ncbi:MAG: succinate--CoA ligase subunit alpha [Negativicutes bacterium]|nr:succinate--CoA ligase subunit alpha [Negativicutes bacterium]
MSILLTKETRAIVQGITGKIGSIQAKWMKECGTNLVGGVTPGGGGKEVHGIPVFDSVAEAVAKQGANAAVLFVPAPYVMGAVNEAIDAGIKLVVCVPEHIPVHDTIKMRAKAAQAGVWVIGPNTPGLFTPGVGKLGIMPSSMFKPGRIGLISRSGTLCYEVAGYINEGGYGESSVVGIGGDMVRCADIQAVLAEFDRDPDTDMVVVVGEVGGTMEDEVASCVGKMHKPVITYVAGHTAPPGKKMGHAGAIINGNEGTAEFKSAALQAAGALTAMTIADIPRLIAKVYK